MIYVSGSTFKEYCINYDKEIRNLFLKTNNKLIITFGWWADKEYSTNINILFNDGAIYHSTTFFSSNYTGSYILSKYDGSYIYKDFDITLVQTSYL